MTAQLHRLLMTLGGLFGGMGSIWTLTEVQPLGIPDEAGAVTALIAALCILLANTIRANYPAATID